MSKHLNNLARRYASVLQDYLADEREAVLHQAYELGRSAIARGLGVLDMARVHSGILAQNLSTAPTPERRQRILHGAEAFLLEALSPFEVTHRGFRETNLKLQHLIATLEKRNLELADINLELKIEIAERKRTEKALRLSERHFRELFDQSRVMQENLRELSSQVLHLQEEERKRISRELHDEVGQALTAISVGVAVLRTMSPTQPGFDARLSDTQMLLRKTMESVHRFARELRPAMLDELGLLPALRSCLNSFARRTGLLVRLRATTVVEQLNPEQKTALFRVAQEAITNVAKHARASHVNVTIRKLKNGVRMEVTDDGRSFRNDPQRSGINRRGLGLLGMQERVRLVHGQFFVKPNPGTGTTVRVDIPFKLLAPRRNATPAVAPATTFWTRAKPRR